MARRRRIPADVASADIALYQCAPMLEGPISGRTQQEAIALHLDDEAGPRRHCHSPSASANHRPETAHVQFPPPAVAPADAMRTSATPAA